MRPDRWLRQRWARELTALGHDVRLIPPAYVKPYVKRSKTDAADAAAICEAVGRPHMRFVPVKSRDEQAPALSYKTRALLVAQRTALVNALRAHLSEFGVVAVQGPRGSARLIDLVRKGDERLPALARESLAELADMIAATEAKIAAIAAQNEASRRLMAVPGVGPVAASTILALAGDVRRFRTGRGFAAPRRSPDLRPCGSGSSAAALDGSGSRRSKTPAGIGFASAG